MVSFDDSGPCLKVSQIVTSEPSTRNSSPAADTTADAEEEDMLAIRKYLENLYFPSKRAAVFRYLF